MNLKLPHNIISRLRTDAPSRETGGWGRRYGDFSDLDEHESMGYNSVCVYVQNGLAKYVELFKGIAIGIFNIQRGNNQKYPLIVFGFGDTKQLQHENKYFDFGYTNDIYNTKEVAETIARISGDTHISPAIIPKLFPKVGIRSLYEGKIKVDSQDLLIIIGNKGEVFFNTELKGRLNYGIRKHMLYIEIESDKINYHIKPALEFKDFDK